MQDIAWGSQGERKRRKKMLEVAWKVHGSIRQIAASARAMSELVDSAGAESARELVPRICEARRIAENIRASIQDLDAHKQLLLQAYSYGAYASHPQVMLAPAKQWLDTLDAVEDLFHALEVRFQRFLV